MIGSVPSGGELEASGVVVIVDDARRVAHISDCCDALLGQEPQGLVGAPLDAALGGEVARIAQDVLREDSDRAGGWWPARLPNGARVRVRAFTPAPGLLALDLLPTGGPGPIEAETNPIERVAGWNDRLLASASSPDLLLTAAKVARSRLGFDGAWVCRIESIGHNIVVANDDPGGPDLVGQAVEAIDVPPGQPSQGGRSIPFFVTDLAAPAANLVPPAPHLNLEGSTLLRPYPEFLGRLASIGVRATASLPIVVAGRLWGRILIHHPTATAVPAATQSELRLLGAATGARLAELIEQEDAREQLALGRYSLRLMGAVASTPDLVGGLIQQADDLIGICAAEGAIVAIDGRVATCGLEAPKSEIDALLAIGRSAVDGSKPPVASAVTLDVDAGSAIDASTAAGYLAIRIGATADDILIWTRREDRRAVRWVQHQVVGDTVADDLFAGIATRQEDSNGTCAPWTSAQLAQAEALRDAIGQVQLARFAQMRALNAELARSNEQYDAFAHAAAHDLMAPLRGIRQFTEFHLEDTGDRLTEDEQGQLHTIVRLAARMQGLLDDLMAYAQIGRDAWMPAETPLEVATAEARELLGLEDGVAQIEVEDASMTTDPGALRHVLLNLIGNAIKYSDGPATIEIGRSTLDEVSRTAPPPDGLEGARPDTEVLTVADRGIGIDPSHHDHVFALFRQLEPSSAGTGAGLAICRLICRRQGGDIWLSSEPGVGTTFYVVPQS
ncbi:MAG: ATP-binding protein [Solirubrobacteraceae bacterium]|nr:ATP-binding protein [Solirubrobacteraceae bacterium]